MTQSYPTPVTPAMLATANAANEGKPRYGAAGAADWAGGAVGDDVDQSTANVALANDHGGAAAADYTPRNQAQKAGLANLTAGTVIVTDIARPRGWIAPNQPLQGNTAVPAAPVVTSISPTTLAATSLPVKVTITGTGFSLGSTVLTGGSNVPDSSGTYVSPTTMTVAIWKASAGTVSVAVEDHNRLSNTDKVFTVT